MIVAIDFEVPDEKHAERLIFFLDKLCGLKFKYNDVMMSDGLKNSLEELKINQREK